MPLKNSVWLGAKLCHFYRQYQAIFPDKRKLLRGLFFFGGLISLGRLFFFFVKLDASLDRNPDAIFDHTALFNRFKDADNKLCYGQKLTRSQEDVIKVLEAKGFTDSQIFNLFLGRYIKPSGVIAVNARLEALLIALVFLLVGLVLSLLVGLAYDLVFHTLGPIALRLSVWAVIAFITVAPTIYLSLLILGPPAVYYQKRIELAEASASITGASFVVIKMHNRQ